MLLIIIIIFLCLNFDKISYFKNDTFYNKWEKIIENSRILGKPVGILSTTKKRCKQNLDTNIMIQSGIAFRPIKFNNGCTYMIQEWENE